MKNYNTAKVKFTLRRFIDHFESNPFSVYASLLSESKNYRVGFHSDKFWRIWDTKKTSYLENKSAKTRFYSQRIEQLRKLVTFENLLIESKKSLYEQRNEFAASKKRFLVQVFGLKKAGFPETENWNLVYPFKDVLKAYKHILKGNWFVPSSDEYSSKQTAFIEQLLKIYMEFIYIEKMFEYFVMGDFELREVGTVLFDGTIIFSINPRENIEKENNPYLAAKLKQRATYEYYRNKANSDIALAANYERKIFETEQTLKDNIFKVNINDTYALLMFIFLEQEGLREYKDTITSLYFPQEEIDVNNTLISFNKDEVHLLHVIYALAAIQAYAAQYICADAHQNEGIFIKKDNLLQIISTFEEWRNLRLNIEEQENVIDLIVSVNNKLPYNPLIEIDVDEYLLIPISFLEDGGYGRIFYNYLLTDLIFSTHQLNKPNKNGQPEHRKRELAICQTIATKVKLTWQGALVCCNFKWPEGDSWGINGETDIVIHFPEENILYLIELKLNNTLSKSMDSKIKWIEKNIYHGKHSACFQLLKDIRFFRCKEAYPYISKTLKTDPTVSFQPQIIPLILTDTFDIDHKRITLDTNIEVTCISIFEFTNLIEGKLRFSSSKNVKVPRNNGGKWLYSKISENRFWQGVEKKYSLRDHAVVRFLDINEVIGLTVE